MRGRQAFRALRRNGVRVSSGPFWILFHADATPHPRLAFSVNRAVGNAVVRNRARRQLRALFSELVRQRSDLLAPGDYLVGVRVAPFDTGEARTWLIEALEKLAGP